MPLTLVLKIIVCPFDYLELAIRRKSGDTKMQWSWILCVYFILGIHAEYQQHTKYTGKWFSVLDSSFLRTCLKNSYCQATLCISSAPTCSVLFFKCSSRNQMPLILCAVPLIIISQILMLGEERRQPGKRKYGWTKQNAHLLTSALIILASSMKYLIISYHIVRVDSIRQIAYETLIEIDNHNNKYGYMEWIRDKATFIVIVLRKFTSNK